MSSARVDQRPRSREGVHAPSSPNRCVANWGTACAANGTCSAPRTWSTWRCRQASPTPKSAASCATGSNGHGRHHDRASASSALQRDGHGAATAFPNGAGGAWLYHQRTALPSSSANRRSLRATPLCKDCESRGRARGGAGPRGRIVWRCRIRSRRPSAERAPIQALETGPVLRRDRLGGVLHEYVREAA